MHEWSTVGLGGIPGYSYYVGNAAKAARFLKMAGYIGIGFAFIGTTNDVVNACTTGREGECHKAAFRRYSKFGISTAAGVGGGVLGSAVGVGVCAAIGIATAGVGGVACAAIGSVATGYAAGEFTNWGVDSFYNAVGF